MRKALFVMALVLGAGSGAAGQIVMDGQFEDWASVEGIGDATGPEGSVDLLEMKAAHDAENLYVYLRLGADLDLTDVLYPHNVMLLIDADMDAATGYTPRPGFGSESRLISTTSSPTTTSCRPPRSTSPRWGSTPPPP